MPNVSIMVSGQDNFSTAIKSMSSVTKGFSKDVEEMQKKLELLSKNKILLKVDANKALQELKAMETQFSKTGNEADGLKMQLAAQNYENLRRNLGLVTKTAREAEKAIVGLNTETSKSQNRARAFGKTAEVGKEMFAKSAGDSITQIGIGFANNITSMLGAETGNLLSNALSSGISMGVTGASVGGSVGALAGAGVGMVVGLINGATQNQQVRDDAFKSVIQSEYDRINQLQQDNLVAGSSIASSREMDSIAFARLYGDKSIGDQQLEWVKDTANTTPFLYDDLKSLSKTLATYGYSPEESQQRLLQIGDAGAAMGMSAQDMSMVATGLGRMNTSDKATMEHINLLVERDIPAIDYLAEAYGKSNSEIYDMISKGQISGVDAADIIANYMGEDNKDAMAEQSKTFAGLSSIVEGLNQDMQNAMGEGFNSERIKGLEEQIEWMSGEQGEKMMEGNRLIGEFQASLENELQSSIMQARTDVMESDEYQKAIAEENGAAAGRLLMEAETKAKIAYQESDAYQLQLMSQKTMVGKLREALVADGSWETFGYEMGQEFTMGISAAQAELLQTLNLDWYTTIQGNATLGSPGPYSAYGQSSYGYAGSPSPHGTPLVIGASPKAFGQSVVPYDNFPALLHQGERVLTASESRAYGGQHAAAPQINLYGTTIREDADIDRIAQKLAENLMRARDSYAS